MLAIFAIGYLYMARNVKALGGFYTYVTATLGKAAGKDAALGKATLVDLLGVKGAHDKVAALVAEAEDSLASFGGDAEILKAAARFVAERRT